MPKDIGKTLTSKIIFILLCVCIVFTALAYGTVHQPTIAIFYLLTAAVVILWAVDSFKTGIFRFNKTLLQVPIIGTVVYALIQIIPFGNLAETGGVSGIGRTISLEPFWTQMFALHFLALFFIFAASLTFLDSASRLRKMTTLITVFGFAFAFFAILQAVLSPTKIYGIYEVEYAKPFGSFVNRHNFAAYIEMAIAVPLGLLFAGAVQRDKRLIYLTAIGLMGVALLLSGSRGGLVAVLAEVVFILILTNKSQGSGKLFIKIGLAVLLIGVIIGGAIMIGGESSLTRFAETAVSNDISTNRTHIWGITLQVIKNNLPFGAGIGAFAAAYTPYDTMNGIERVEQAHNDYLQILADAGIVGLLLAGFFIYQLFRTGLQNVKTDNLFRRGVAIGAFAGCFAILVHSLFDFVLHTTAITVLFLTLASLVVVSGRHFADDEHTYERRRSRKASVTSIEDKRSKDKG
ncbi:MAG TPA: O-antigen ligase family protein [Pyrinomonadaceae bacterium]|nr:O-antigen ligase family protein [Pyrinomonadaceae bacterium]